MIWGEGVRETGFELIPAGGTLGLIFVATVLNVKQDAKRFDHGVWH
jgi:hypothetical protein